MLSEAVTTLTTSGDVVFLRGLDAASARGDVDVLVSTDDVKQVTDSLFQDGWLVVPGKGHGSHRFLVTFDGDRWLKLDLVTRLDFGLAHQHRTELATACLRRKSVADGLPVLHADDDFWWTFLHFTWKQLDPGRLEELSLRAGPARPAGPVADVVGHVLGADEDALHALIDAARRRDGQSVGAAQRLIRRRWRMAQPLQAGRRTAMAWVERRVVVADRPGVSVALLGLDGAGKSTVSERLQSEVAWPTTQIYMGVWKQSRLDFLLRRVLGAQLLLRIQRLGVAGARVRYHRALGRAVILDRFLVDADLPSTDLDWKGRATRRLVVRLAPEPDRLVFLDAPAEVVFARKGELDETEANARRAFYLALAAEPPWRVVEATAPIEQVVRDVGAILWQDLLACHRLGSSPQPLP
jgi:thymidylate kinase